MHIYFSDSTLQHFPQVPEYCADRFRQFLRGVESIENLCLHQYPNTKRLKGKPTLWRYRCGDYRLVFGGINNPESLVVHGVGHRSKVYDHLPHYLSQHCQFTTPEIEEEDTQETEWDLEFCDDQEYHNHNRYYRFRLDQLQTQQDLINCILSGQYRYLPHLSQEQTQLKHQLFNSYQAQVYRIQGSAGTGKTTLGLQIALDAIDNNGFFPFIIVPNHSLQEFAKTVIKAQENPYQVYSDSSPQESPDLAIFTRQEIFKLMAQSEESAITSSLGCARMIKKLETRSPIEQFRQENLYAILQSMILKGNYQLNEARDIFGVTYSEVVKFLKKNWHSEYIDIFEGRDAYSIAQKADANFLDLVPHLQSLATGKEIIFIIDEVQDFYWFELKVLLKLASAIRERASIILLGDENQRVTISGFSWSNLATTFDRDFGYSLDKENCLTRNFRNSKNIAKAAKYLLLDAFPQTIKKGVRHLTPPGDPEHCYQEGEKPKLIIINQEWINKLIPHLENLAQEIGERKLVLIEREITDNYLQSVDRLQNISNIYCYSISEVKGQEFESAILLFPFAKKSSNLKVDDLFDWYTAVTRARSHLALLIDSSEYQWLLKNAQGNLKEYFDLAEQLSPEQLVEEIKEVYLTTISIEQNQEIFIIKLRDELLAWLKGGNPPQDILARAEKLNFIWWKLAEGLKYDCEYLTENSGSLGDLKAVDLTAINPKDALIILPAIQCLLESVEINTKKYTRNFINYLTEFWQSNPQQIPEVDSVDYLDLKAIIYRSTHRSWAAAKLFISRQDKSPVKEIIEDLEQKNLLYEAARMRLQILGQKPDKNLPFANALQEQGSLIEVLSRQLSAKLGEESNE